MPCFRVAVEDGQPEHEPLMWRNTTPSLKPRKVMSPPSLATAGRTRVSISSLMMATVSASSLSKNSSAPAASIAPLTIGAPDMKCSMMAPRIAGLICCHSVSDFVTVMKSLPRNTPATPGTPNSRSARGDFAASAALGMSRTPSGNTGRPGRNFRVAGFGVASVWMNILKVSTAALGSRPKDITTYNQQHGSFGLTGQQLPQSSTHRVDIGDTQPLLAMIAIFDDAQQHDAHADARGAAARVIHGAVAFGRVVDDHQVLRLVTRLVAPSLTAH